MTIYTRALRVLLITCCVVATVYTYWTRTPQYALLHALRPETGAEAMTHRDPKIVRKRPLAARPSREPLTYHLATLQNRVLEKGYGIHVQHLDNEGRSVILRVDVNATDYALRLYEEPDGRWRLEDFPARADLFQVVTATRSHHPLLLLARL